VKICCAFPSLDYKRAKETATRWKNAGYLPLVIMNKEHVKKGIPAMVCAVEGYEGYYRAMNWACQSLVEHERADIVVCISDRMRPPQNKRSEEVGQQFASRFRNGQGIMVPLQGAESGDLKPCGPWIGKRFIQKYYGGKGPYYERYFQFYGNRELFTVANRDGLLWLRDDLDQEVIGGETDFYRKANREEYWTRDQGVFVERQEMGFPGSEARKLDVVNSLWLPPGYNNGVS